MYNPNLHFHFTGIGGSGMSGIAEVLVHLGFKVSGSDLAFSPTCKQLSELGIPIIEGHAASNLPDSCSLLVYSSAVQQDNPELIEARRRGLPVVRRAEVLAELMRLKFGVAVSGSHGKTTTTSMTGTVLEAGGLDPTVIIGGRVKGAIGGKLGKSDFLVAESDESDRSFLLLRPTIAIGTNIDAEHMEAYSSLRDLEDSFKSFLYSVPFYGLSIFCVDDLKLRQFAEECTGRKTTYGLSPDAEIRAENIVYTKRTTEYDVMLKGEKIFRAELPIPGKHLMVNSLASVAVGLELGMGYEDIKKGLASFAGVERRLETLYEANGRTVISDYGHHPTEIKATVRAVRAAWGEDLGRLRVVFQPHRYSRTRDCFFDFLDSFHECDELLISDIYSAGEEQIEGVSASSLAKMVNHPKVQHISEFEEIGAGLRKDLREGDLVLFLGAGSIGAFARSFAESLS